MAIQFLKKLYAISESGALVEIGKHLETDPNLFPVGGKIFYIDSNSDETVKFYDQNGDVINSVSVGDTPYAYKVTNPGTSGKDKYYVYYDSIYTLKTWAPSEYQETFIGGTSRDFGSGKLNTQIVMAYSSGALIAGDAVWYQIKQMRDNLYGGCDDWYLPSEKEIYALRNAITYEVVTTSDPPVIMPAGPITGGTIAGTADGQAHYLDYMTNRICYPSETKLLSNSFWSSSEGGNRTAWIFYQSTQGLYEATARKSGSGHLVPPSMFAIRSF